MKKIFAFVSAAALGLGLAACDSAAENTAEDQADVTESAMEEQADALNDQGAITDAQEDAMVEEADATGDAMEDQADTMDAGAPE